MRKNVFDVMAESVQGQTKRKGLKMMAKWVSCLICCLKTIEGSIRYLILKKV